MHNFNDWSLLWYFSVMFLILSAVCLTYKILDLEAKMAANAPWSDTDSQHLRYARFINIFHFSGIMECNVVLVSK